MKTIISLLLFIILFDSSFAQSDTTKPMKVMNKESYLHRSKVNGIIGNSLLGAGALLFVTGLVIDKVKQPELLAGFAYEFFGLSSAVISIPFFIIAAKNKRKALSFTFDAQKAVNLRQSVASTFMQPAVSFKIDF